MIELSQDRNPLSGAIQLSGSKSISNRLLVLQHILGQNLNLTNLSDSEDTVILKSALQQINERKSFTIDVNHAGTNMRFLTALLSITDGTWILTGSSQLKARPVFPLVQALQSIGADIKYLEATGFPPLQIQGKLLNTDAIEIDANVSSQFVSALLLIAPTFKNGVTIKLNGQIASRPYLQMTIDLLNQLACSVQFSANAIVVSTKLENKINSNFHIESDWSSASYYYSFCALFPDSQITLNHLQQKSLQADAVLPNIYEALGVSSTFNGNSLTLKHTKSDCTFFEYDFSDCPDIAQTVALTCFALGIKARLTGLKTLKLKETDRILALKTELEKLGAEVQATNESIVISPSNVNNLNNSPIISTYADHRMAMSFAPLVAKYKSVFIEDHQVVNKSYPDFWNDLLSLGFSVNLRP